MTRLVCIFEGITLVAGTGGPEINSHCLEGELFFWIWIILCESNCLSASETSFARTIASYWQKRFLYAQTIWFENLAGPLWSKKSNPDAKERILNAKRAGIKLELFSCLGFFFAFAVKPSGFLRFVCDVMRTPMHFPWTAFRKLRFADDSLGFPLYSWLAREILRQHYQRGRGCRYPGDIEEVGGIR